MALHTPIRNSISCHNFFTILLALLFISTLLYTSSASNSCLKTYKKFIKAECNSTTYPKVCYKSLSPYASRIKTNPLLLTKTSIFLALKVARSASTTVTKLSMLKGLTHAESEAIEDCKENTDDTVDELKKSSDAVVHLNGTNITDDEYQWDNVKTWMSAAITDEDTCSDVVDELEVRTSLRKKIKNNVANVARMASYSLALVNKLTYKMFNQGNNTVPT